MTARAWIALYYFAYLGALGIVWPYLSLYLISLGFGAGEITQVLLLSPAMGLIAPPLFGLVADALSARGWLLRAASVGAALAFAGFFHARSHAAIYLVFGLFAFCRAPLLPMTDAAAFELAERAGGSYGRMRLWGSIGFLTAVLVGGRWMEAGGQRVVLQATSVGLVASAAIAFGLPAPPARSIVRPQALGAWLELLGSARMWLFLGAVALGQAAGAAYDGCFSLHLLQLGFGPRVVGLAWAIGVAAEILLMMLAARAIARVGAERLFAFAIAVAAARWLLMAHLRSEAAILALQPLHGISFGWFYVSGVTLMRDRGLGAPTAAQGLFAAALSLGSVAGMAAAGRLFEGGGGLVLYSTAAAVAGLGTACAIAYARRPLGQVA